MQGQRKYLNAERFGVSIRWRKSQKEGLREHCNLCPAHLLSPDKHPHTPSPPYALSPIARPLPALTEILFLRQEGHQQLQTPLCERSVLCCFEFLFAAIGNNRKQHRNIRNHSEKCTKILNPFEIRKGKFSRDAQMSCFGVVLSVCVCLVSRRGVLYVLVKSLWYYGVTFTKLAKDWHTCISKCKKKRELLIATTHSPVKSRDVDRVFCRFLLPSASKCRSCSLGAMSEG